MHLNSIAHPRLSALAAACLLSVALPAAPALAQGKTKTKAPPAAAIIEHSVSVPTIEATGSNVSDEVLSAILSGAIVEHAEELATLDADSISVPQIVVTITSQRDGESNEAVMTVSDLVLTNIDDGVAASVSVGGISMVTDEANAEFLTMSASNFNIGLMLGVYGLVDTTGKTELETIYTDFSAAGGTMSADDVSCEFGGVGGAEFKARPLKTSFAELMAIASDLEDDPEDMDPALIGQFMHIYADILTAFETSEVTFDGMSCWGEDNSGNPMTIDIAGMTMGGMSPGYYPSISMDGFTVDVENDGSMSLENFTFKPMDLTALIATLESAPANVDEAWLEANARSLFPEMEGFSFSGFAIDIPDPDNDDTRIKADIGLVDLTLAKYLNGIPTDLDLVGNNIRLEIPENADDEVIEQLRTLGVTDIDAGFRVAAAWNEATNSIDVHDVSVSGKDLASVFLAGKITNATAKLFSMSPDEALVAAMQLGVGALDLSVTDAGLADLLLAVAAKDQGSSPEALRSIYAGLAQGTVIGMLAGVADAAKLGEAVNLFVGGKAKTLNINLTSKDEAGLGMADFMAAEDDPASLLPKINISAEAK